MEQPDYDFEQSKIESKPTRATERFTRASIFFEGGIHPCYKSTV